MTPEETRWQAWHDSMDDLAGNRGKLLRWMQERGETGTILEEAATATGMQWTTAGALIIQLREAGWVRQSTTEPTRKTTRNKHSAVWVLVNEQIPVELREVPRSRRYQTALARCVAALEGVIEIQRRHPGDTPLRMVDCARAALTSPEVVALTTKRGHNENG